MARKVGAVHYWAERYRALVEAVPKKARSYRGLEWDEYQKSLEDIYADQTPAGDCALVQLTSDNPDASFGENVEYHITKRGKRMLPILGWAISHPTRLLDITREKFRRDFIMDCIKAIKEGRRIGFY